MNIACWIWACCTHFILQNKLTLLFFSVKCWVSFCGLWFHLMTSARGWSQFCRSWTLASASFFRKSKRTTVNIMQFVFTHYPNKDMRSGSDSPCGFFLRQLPAKLLQTYMTFIFLLCRRNQNKSLKTLTEVLLQLLNATFGIYLNNT